MCLPSVFEAQTFDLPGSRSFEKQSLNGGFCSVLFVVGDLEPRELVRSIGYLLDNLTASLLAVHQQRITMRWGGRLTFYVRFLSITYLHDNASQRGDTLHGDGIPTYLIDTVRAF